MTSEQKGTLVFCERLGLDHLRHLRKLPLVEQSPSPPGLLSENAVVRCVDLQKKNTYAWLVTEQHQIRMA